MQPTRHSDDDILTDLGIAIERAGSLRKLARLIGLSPTMLSVVMRRKVSPGPTIAAYLGYHDDGLRWIKSQGKSGRAPGRKSVTAK